MEASSIADDDGDPPYSKAEKISNGTI